MINDHPDKAGLAAAMASPRFNETLFDGIPDTVYFVKDAAGRYLSVNQTLVERCGLVSKQALLGRTAEEAFPGALGVRIAAQDRAVIDSGQSIHSKLKLHLYANGREGWCLTWKAPLCDPRGEALGLCGISRDLQQQAATRPDYQRVCAVLQHIDSHFDTPLRLPDLASLAGLSSYQLDKRVRALLGLSIGQYITRVRIEHGCHLLRRTADPISDIALACGYGDQASFSRQFRSSVGLSPAAYRKVSGR